MFTSDAAARRAAETARSVLGPTLLLGVDCGATWSKGALFSVEGRDLALLAVGSAGSANPNVVGASRARAALEELVRTLLLSARVAGDEVAAAAIGGADAGLIRAAAGRTLPGTPVLALSDVVLPAFASPGRPEAPVVALIGGTGSMAVRLVPGALEHASQAGGWGWFLGDDGGAVDMGRRVVRAVLAELDGGPPTLLTGALAAELGTREQGEALRDVIYRAVYGELAPHLTVSRLAPLLVAAAQEDEVADSSLAALVGNLRETAARVHHPGDWIVAAGSVACAVRQRLEPALLRAVGDPDRLMFTPDGVPGATIAAGESAGVTVDPARCSALWLGARPVPPSPSRVVRSVG
jgi:glucosamine kinase